MKHYMLRHREPTVSERDLTYYEESAETFARSIERALELAHGRLTVIPLWTHNGRISAHFSAKPPLTVSETNRLREHLNASFVGSA